MLFFPAALASDTVLKSTSTPRLGRLLRSALAGLGALCLLHSAACAASFALTVVHVNDTHSYAAGSDARKMPCLDERNCFGGYARIARAIQSERAANRNVLALDAGDAWQGTLFFSSGSEAFSLAVERAMPYDAVTLGNHEFDLGCAAASRYVDALDKPVVAANLIRDETCPLSRSGIVPYKIFTFDGVRTAVIGLANDEVCEISKACAHTRFKDRRQALQESVAALKKMDVRHIIVLSHLGYDADQELARTVCGVDLFVGGHTHSILGRHEASEGPYPTVVASADGSRSLIVQAGVRARFAGSITLFFDDRGRVASYAGELRELTPDMPGSHDVSAIVQKQSRVVSGRLHQIVARARDMGDDGLDYCRTAECPTGLLTADAYLAFGKPYGATVALVNSGSIRSPLPIGDVSFADLQNIHPFGNTLTVVQMQGREIRAALEHGLTDPDVAGPRLLQPAGLRYAVHGQNPVGHRLGEVEIRNEDGSWRRLEDDEKVRVALTDYLLHGGDAFCMIKDSAERSPDIAVEDNVTDLTAFLRYIRSLADGRLGELPSPEFGRIRGMGKR